MNKELVAQIAELVKMERRNGAGACAASGPAEGWPWQPLGPESVLPRGREQQLARQEGGAGGTSCSARFDQILSDLRTELSRLCEGPSEQQDFESFEGELHQCFVTAERAVLACELERLDVNCAEVSIDGRRYRRVLRGTETYTSAVGPITVTRTLYRAGTEQAVVPVELRAGIIGGHWTPLAAHQASYLVAHLTPREGAAVLRELGNMNPSASSLERLPKQLNQRWEEQREAFEEALRASSVVVPDEATTLAVSLDGVMAPMRDGARQAKRAQARAAGRATKGPAGYREVGCGTVSCYDAAGERLGTVRCGRMPEAGKATLKEMLSAEVATALEQRPDLRVVKLADAARDNWSYLGQLAPQAASSAELVDFFHAAEQLKAATDAAYGKSNPRGRAQYEKHRHVLRHEHGGVERVIRALRYLRGKHPRRKRIKKVLGYFCRNRKRMDYAGAAQCGLPIGSGVVEAACKTLVTERMKRSGMRWRQDGGQAILTLRGWAQSGRFATAWSLLSATYRHDVTVSEDVESTHGRAA